LVVDAGSAAIRIDRVGERLGPAAPGPEHCSDAAVDDDRPARVTRLDVGMELDAGSGGVGVDVDVLGVEADAPSDRDRHGEHLVAAHDPRRGRTLHLHAAAVDRDRSDPGQIGAIDAQVGEVEIGIEADDGGVDVAPVGADRDRPCAAQRVRRREDEAVVDDDAGAVRRPRIAASDIDADDRGRRVVGAPREREQRDDGDEGSDAPQTSSFDIQIESSIR
jgi:hypothetical protein